MSQKFIQSTLLGGALLAALTFGNFNANAKGFDTIVDLKKESISANQFYSLLNKTEADKVVKIFGAPDKMATLTNAEGSQKGVVWTYKKAVSQKNEKLDANFVFVAGEFKYVTLSKS